LGDLVATIFSWVLWIAAVVLIYVVFIAAFDLITKKEVVTVRENAKKRLLNALIGFVLILLAQSIPGIIRDFLAG
jgi:dolichyl-phosphate-mannose--protein O-mannosyl transferase